MTVNELRELRRDANMTQRGLADLLKIPANTFRMWDSGLRCAPAHVVAHARVALDAQARRRQLLALADLAIELDVHVRTLQAAARKGLLETQFSVRSVFGRPMRFASREAGDEFIARHYRCFSGQEVCPLPLPTVPDDYDDRLRGLRRRMRLTQDALARRIGAAGKAVVYQWESRKRTPSPVLWARVEALDRVGMDGRRPPISPKGPAHFSNRLPTEDMNNPRPTGKH